MSFVRLAWFSPFPPVRTGIAAVSAEVVAALRARHEIDTYPSESAHDFPWRHRRHPYDLVVYQFGNSSHHDYEWAYALRYPGLVVLHDTRLHHARAAFLLREKRASDYRAEFRWNHPGLTPDAAELGVAGFDSALYYEWPMTRALIESARVAASHVNPRLRNAQLSIDSQLQTPEVADSEGRQLLRGRVISIRLGHGELVTPERRREARTRVRAAYGIEEDAVLFVSAGGVTPEKRIPQILGALQAIGGHAPAARLLLVGAAAAHYDVGADVAARGLSDRVIVTGYLASDADLTDHLAAADVSLNLRWPTAGEVSGPWLRALAAGVATVITDLAHLGDVPSLDPRTWTMNVEVPRSMVEGQGPAPTAQRDYGVPPVGAPTSQLRPRSSVIGHRPSVCVAIDILDEDHSLRLAMRRLAADPALRDTLGRAGQEYWRREHTVEAMVEDYERAIALAAGSPDPEVALPAHMRDAGDRTLRSVMAEFGMDVPW